MHHKIGRAAGYIAAPTWTTYVTGTIVNMTTSWEDRIFRGELLMLLAVSAVTSTLVWITHIAVKLSTEERKDLYAQGVKDGVAIGMGESSDGLSVATIRKHRTQRLNGTAGANSAT